MQSTALALLISSLTVGMCLAQLADCPNEVPSQCFTSSSTNCSTCSTCSCTSSSNVEFYQPSMGEPMCMESSATYEVKFVATWTAACHPDYYFNSAHWSPLTGISHKPEYELWDACMYNVSPGVALVSQTGSTSTINSEYDENSQYVLDMFDASVLNSGAGTVTAELNFDSDHQYVSVVTMLAPSADRMMGVSLLRLCAGSEWRQTVKLCGELFSTATKSARVSDTRNSIQYNNCSFGYFEFTLLSVSAVPSASAVPSTSPTSSPSAGQMVVPHVGFIVVLLAIFQLFLWYSTLP